MKFIKNGLEFKQFDNSYEDISFIEDLYSDKDVKKYMPFIKKNTKMSSSMYNTPFIVKDIDTDDLIGYVYFHEPGLEEVEIMYATHHDYRREGYGRRLLSGASEFILEKEKSINNIALIINTKNEASQNTALAAGFNRTGNIRYERKR
ncbi:MAG: GNAT family N-acetyltransferase [Bacilli bacterium]